MEGEEKTINGHNWFVELDPSPDALFKFELGSTAVLIKGVSLGVFTESNGIVKKQQLHHRADGLGQDCHSETVIPFGVEPLVRRDTEFSDGSLRVVTDIGIGGRASYDDIEVDPLEITGKLRRIAVADIPESGQPFPEPKWQELTAAETVFFSGDKPFLYCIVEDEQGKCLTIGCGDDLWRWSGAAELEGVTAEFSIAASTAGVAIRRKPYIFPKEFSCGNRSWRFKWFIGWCGEQQAVTGDWEELKLDPAELPDHIQAADASGKRHPDMICKQAPAWRKAFKKAVRAAAARGAKIYVKADQPVFCGDAAHMERNRKSFLPHCDMMISLELYQWAKQTMKAANGDFRIE